MTHIGLDGSTSTTGPRGWQGRLDGIEMFEGNALVASQSDSTLYAVDGESRRGVVRTPGTGADIM